MSSLLNTGKGPKSRKGAPRDALSLSREGRCGLALREREATSRLADAVAERAGLAREPAAVHRADDVVLADPVGHPERLVDHHAQHRPREIDGAVAVVDGDLAGAGLQPDAGHRVLALAGGIGAALGV